MRQKASVKTIWKSTRICSKSKGHFFDRIWWYVANDISNSSFYRYETKQIKQAISAANILADFLGRGALKWRCGIPRPVDIPWKIARLNWASQGGGFKEAKRAQSI